jgi:hypothetical protein
VFEIILLIVATGGIASYARGRGGKPWLWGALTVVGYFLVPFLVGFFAVLFGADPKVVKDDAQIWFFISAVAWVAILAFCARFLLGRNYAKPGGMWSLSELQVPQPTLRRALRSLPHALRLARAAIFVKATALAAHELLRSGTKAQAVTALGL